MRSMAVAEMSPARTWDAAASTVPLVARTRLIPKSASASRARSMASCARAARSAASLPMAIATARNSSRLSHSSGSATVSVYRGWTKRKS